MVWFQSQPRAEGKLDLSSTKLELPGGSRRDAGGNQTTILSSFDFEINGRRPDRYHR